MKVLGRGEQLNHKALKEYGHQLLNQMGFKDSEVHEEYGIKTSGMKEGFRVDVVGINPSRKVAVECGLTNTDKITWLKLFFDEVYILPFFNMKSSEALADRRIRELETELAETTRELEDLKQESIKIIANYEVDIESMILGLLEPIAKKHDFRTSNLIAGKDNNLVWIYNDLKSRKEK